MNINKQFQENLNLILTQGFKKEDRTGVGTISYPGIMLRHDMSDGFPLLTLRKIPFKSAAVELEGFIKGITSKKWYKDRGCGYWSSWAAPYKVKYATDTETKKKMEEEDDLGPIYGKQGRAFGQYKVETFYHGDNSSRKELLVIGKQVDQLQNLVNELKNNPNSRRMYVSYWNPLSNDLMALMPCHLGYQVNVTDGKLNLFYTMRSVDFILGSNANSYGLLLHLLAKEAGLKEGVLTGFFADAHVYINQLAGAHELLKRDTNIPLPKIKTEKFTSIFDWEHKDTELLDYNPQAPIKFEVAV